mgnify:CR=1 FL=1
MRLPLATDLKARVGTPDKDARVKNGIIEIRGESSVVRQRPGVSEALATDLGLFAQGGMQFGDYLVYLNNDVVFVFSDFGFYDVFRITDGVSLMWSSGGSYSIGDMVYDEEDDSPSYALVADPPFRPTDATWGDTFWSRTPPSSDRWVAQKLGYESSPQCATPSAAGAMIYLLFTQISCATKNPGTWTWVTYAGADDTNFYVDQYSDSGSADCSSAPILLGRQTSGSVSQVV